MRKSLLIALLLAAAACTKDEPFEYPEPSGKYPPEWVVHSERRIRQEEAWKVEKSADQCSEQTPLNNQSVHELNYDKGFAVMHLVPADSECVLNLSLASKITNAEITDYPWDSLWFEFTFFEFSTAEGASFVVSLYYKNLQLDVDLSPLLANLDSVDRSNGVFKLHFESGDPAFEINGKRVQPDFETSALNHFSMNGSEDDNYYQLTLSCAGTETQSYVAYKYMRISRFGLTGP